MALASRRRADCLVGEASKSMLEVDEAHDANDEMAGRNRRRGGRSKKQKVPYRRESLDDAASFVGIAMSGEVLVVRASAVARQPWQHSRNKSEEVVFVLVMASVLASAAMGEGK